MKKKIYKKLNKRYVYDKEEGSILGFKGYERYLSNFFLADFTFRGIEFFCSEQAYMYFKSEDPQYARKVLDAKTPVECKRLGRAVVVREDWELIKYKVMYEVVGAKFKSNPMLLRRLLRTGNQYIEETNTWEDYTWGVCNGRGENNLGKILMCIRYSEQKRK